MIEDADKAFLILRETFIVFLFLPLFSWADFCFLYVKVKGSSCLMLVILLDCICFGGVSFENRAVWKLWFFSCKTGECLCTGKERWREREREWERERESLCMCLCSRMVFLYLVMFEEPLKLGSSLKVTWSFLKCNWSLEWHGNGSFALVVENQNGTVVDMNSIGEFESWLEQQLFTL